MNKKPRMIALLAAIGITFAQPVIPQQGQPQPQDMKIDSAVRTQVIEGILRRLNDLYVFPDVAKKNVITGKNWEGLGVIPQVATPSTDALAVAHGLALRRLIEKGTDSVRTSMWQAALESLSRENRR